MYASKLGWISIAVLSAIVVPVCLHYEAWGSLAFYGGMVVLGLYAGKKAEKPSDDE